MLAGLEVNGFRLMEDALAGRHWLVQNYAAQNGRQRIFHLIGPLVSQTGSQGPLSIHVHQKNFFALPRQTDTQVDRRYGFANSAFLVADCRYFRHFAHFWPPSMFIE